MSNNPVILNCLSRLTLIMLTYNRQEYALRNMAYWSSMPVTLIVVDGSQEAINNEKLLEYGSNIKYYHKPESLYERIRFVIGKQNTEYTALLGDDEFYSPTAISKCIQRLDANKELVSCIGRCLAFYEINGVVKGYPDILEQENYSVMNDEPFERMTAHLNPYTPSTIYSITRTKQWNLAMSCAFLKEYAVYTIGERIFEAVNAFLGKSTVIPELMWYRSKEQEGIRNTDISLNRDLFFYQWWFDDEKKNEHDEMLRNVLNTLISGHDDASKYEYDMFKTAFDSHGLWDKEHKKNKKLKRQIFISFTVKLIKIILPEFIIFKLREARKIKHLPLVEAAEEMKLNSVHIDMNELSVIENLVSKFHA